MIAIVFCRYWIPSREHNPFLYTKITLFLRRPWIVVISHYQIYGQIKHSQVIWNLQYSRLLKAMIKKGTILAVHFHFQKCVKYLTPFFANFYLTWKQEWTENESVGCSYSSVKYCRNIMLAVMEFCPWKLINYALIVEYFSWGKNRALQLRR